MVITDNSIGDHPPHLSIKNVRLPHWQAALLVRGPRSSPAGTDVVENLASRQIGGSAADTGPTQAALRNSLQQLSVCGTRSSSSSCPKKGTIGFSMELVGHDARNGDLELPTFVSYPGSEIGPR